MVFLFYKGVASPAHREMSMHKADLVRVLADQFPECKVGFFAREALVISKLADRQKRRFGPDPRGTIFSYAIMKHF